MAMATADNNETGSARVRENRTSMTISRCEIVIVEIPMKILPGQVVFERGTARNLLVRLEDKEGNVGWGEFCARTDGDGESVESARDCLQSRLLPEFLGKVFDSLDDLVATVSETVDRYSPHEHGAFCAAELALLDLFGVATGVSAGSVLGPIRQDGVHYSGVIATDKSDALREHAAMLRKFGVPAVKMTVGNDLDENLYHLDIARQILGLDLRLHVDAAGAWSPEEALRQLEAMAPYHLDGVEQPVAGDDLDSMIAVTAAGIVPVIATDALVSRNDAARLAEARACDAFSVDIARCATRCEGVRWCEGSMASLLLNGRISHPDISATTGGLATALRTPGIGVTVIGDRVREYATSRIAIR
jgi:L-alanine-DL-glutamate epimerase-like enolase superfamily enzyme